jgi:hypothetical protein
MKKQWVRAGAVAALLGGFSIVSLAADEALEKKIAATVAAGKDITRLADDAGKKDWAELSKAGADVAKKHDLESLMNQFKPRRPPPKSDEDKRVSGLGIGPKLGEIKPDGIDAKIINLAGKPMEADALAREQPHLIRMTEICSAVAAAAIHLPPTPPPEGAKPATWKPWMEEMYKASRELQKALKTQKPEAVQEAALALKETCAKCHADWR